ncbi:hypothetical protein EGW08_002724 [Elysia chlorotica]|uniref:PiggyBac transposable element-derived protein domain-containing protein n=1 Tax=Elysia chlorotica TaxID=188477 RepID=A0A3S1AE35_ELYCH|nr:hypothetical protein EGW08_002724 [Elysia chlorotica]
MSDQGAGPSGTKLLTREQVLDVLDGESDNDFDIPHASDDSGSSSGSEDEEQVRSRSRPSEPEVERNGGVDVDVDLDDEVIDVDWSTVSEEQDRSRPRSDPSFTARKASHHIGNDCTRPVDFFYLFFTQELMTTLLRETNRYAQQFLNLPETVAWIENHPKIHAKQEARFGIKKFQLCDNNGFVVDIKLYAGRDFDVHHDEGMALGVVEDLLVRSRVLNKEYMLFTDNFYTKPKLAKYLL